MKVVFWQDVFSPHLIYLSNELSKIPNVEVLYVAECEMVSSRLEFGWEVNLPSNSNFIIAPDKLKVKEILEKLSPNCIHICQGFREVGINLYAKEYLKNNNITYWVIAEEILIKGLFGLFKSIFYLYIIYINRKSIKGLLSIGYNANKWFIKIPLQKKNIFSFTYFLSDEFYYVNHNYIENKTIKLIFVGQLIQRKRVDLLINALSNCKLTCFDLTIVGSGLLENKLKLISNNNQKFKITWCGNLKMHEVKSKIQQSDCLILPSDFDGWGAVTTESLMLGTNVICSTGCGSAEVVKESPYGIVFEAGNVIELTKALNKVIDLGKLDPDKKTIISNWSRKIGAKYGAKYLHKILTFSYSENHTRPIEPWLIK
jgi:glycosyltransferase involved in cell wall biosynthesis